jgi:hypothetical protein
MVRSTNRGSENAPGRLLAVALATLATTTTCSAADTRARPGFRSGLPLDPIKTSNMAASLEGVSFKRRPALCAVVAG